MDRFPATQITLAIVSAIQAAFSAWGTSMNAPMAFAWGAAAIIISVELIFRSPFRTLIKFLLAGLSIAVVVASVMWFAYLPVIHIKVKNSFIASATGGSTYVRFSVENSGFREAACFAYLDDISKIEAGQLKPLYVDYKFPLSAQNAGDANLPNGFLIPAGDIRYFNAFAVDANTNRLHISSKMWFDLEHEPLTEGTYKVIVQVSGKDCPVTRREFTIEWHGGKQKWIE